jgi:hypothetical protein
VGFFVNPQHPAESLPCALLEMYHGLFRAGALDDETKPASAVLILLGFL